MFDLSKSEERERPLIFTHPDCEYSGLLRDDLIASGREFDEIDLSEQPEQWAALEQLSGGDRTTPLLVEIDGTVQVGYGGIG